MSWDCKMEYLNGPVGLFGNHAQIEAELYDLAQIEAEEYDLAQVSHTGRRW